MLNDLLYYFLCVVIGLVGSAAYVIFKLLF